MQIKAIAFLSFILVGISHINGQEVWKLTKSKNEIKVFVSEVSGSDYYAFKAIMTVNANVNEIVAVFKDVSAYTQWFAFTASASMVKQTGTQQFIFMETDYPWPYSNECMYYQMDFKDELPVQIKITITGIAHETTEGDCRQMKSAKGFVLLEPNGKEMQITYVFHSVPSQNIPATLVNAMLDEMPYQTFMALRDRLGSFKGE